MTARHQIFLGFTRAEREPDMQAESHPPLWMEFL